MQNNLMKVDNDFQEENEISIYDIVNIFLKNIKKKNILYSKHIDI